MNAMCENKELIVGYVYDELSPDERETLNAHVAVCAECRIELDELRVTRMHLAQWAPPEPDLGFRLIRGGAAQPPASPGRSRFVPPFAFAAAAVIVLAVAASIANVEVRYDADGMTVRTGWAREIATRNAQLETTPVESRQVGATVPGSEDFATLDRRLREIELALASAPPDSAPPLQMVSADSGLSDAEILRRVQQLVREAEERQETAVARRLLQVLHDLEVQRRADLAVMQQGLGHYQGLTNAEIAQNRDMLNQLVQVATRQEK